MARTDWQFGQTKGPPWPRTEEGKPIPPVFLTHVAALDLEGQILISLLESSGISVIAQLPLGGEFGKIILGFSGTGIDLYVPETQLEDAEILISGEFEEEAESDESHL